MYKNDLVLHVHVHTFTCLHNEISYVVMLCICATFKVGIYLYELIERQGVWRLTIQFEYSLLKCRVVERHQNIGVVVVSV